MLASWGPQNNHSYCYSHGFSLIITHLLCATQIPRPCQFTQLFLTPLGNQLYHLRKHTPTETLLDVPVPSDTFYMNEDENDLESPYGSVLSIEL